MIAEHDLDEAIALYQGKLDPTPTDCVRLAAFYTVKNELYGGKSEPAPAPSYSFAAAPASDSIVSYDSGSELSRVINGRHTTDVLAVFDELMDALRAIYPAMYQRTLEKLKR